MNLVDLAAERALLAGTCKFGSEVYNDISDIITVGTFSNEINQVIYKCIEHHVKDKIDAKVDLPSIFSAANSLGLSHMLDKDDSRKMVRAILNMELDSSNLRKLAAKLRKLQIARDLGSVIDEAKAALANVTGDETVTTILSTVENPIFEYSMGLSDGKQSGPQLIGRNIKERLEYLRKNPVEQIGISTGFPEYDFVIGGGLRRRTVNVTAARAKMGKTSIANNMCIHIAGKLNLPILNLDTEMCEEDQQYRMIAAMSGVPINDISTGKFAKNKQQDILIGKASDLISSMPYHYQSVAGLPFEDIISIMRRWVTKVVGMNSAGEANPCVILFDYLKLMDPTNLKIVQEYQELGFMMTSLQNFMVKYSVPCQTFVQLNRDGLDKENESTVSGSDRISWFCSSLGIFKAKQQEEIAEDVKSGCKENYNRKYIPILSRYGPGLDYGDYINMKFEGQYCRITEGPTRNNIHDIDIIDKNKGHISHDDDVEF